MKYTILIHSNPQPWGHPTCDRTAAYQALTDDAKAKLGARFDQVFGDVQSSGELLFAAPLGDPHEARIFRHDGTPENSQPGPYAQGDEHLAGFFVVDVASQERAEEIAQAFSCPGDTVELRSVM